MSVYDWEKEPQDPHRNDPPIGHYCMDMCRRYEEPKRAPSVAPMQATRAPGAPVRTQQGKRPLLRVACPPPKARILTDPFGRLAPNSRSLREFLLEYYMWRGLS